MRADGDPGLGADVVPVRRGVMADTQRFPGDDGWLIQITSRVKRLEEALKLARPVLAGELESLCYSFCPEGEE